MADLSAYIDFTVSLDLSQGKIVLTDTGQYPNGVPAGIIGIIQTRQPDNITRPGDWNKPDVQYSGSALTLGLVELRKNADNTLQQGVYSITYTVDHPSYTPTQLTKTFSVSYSSPSLVVTELFDVFTPSLKLSDDTSYNVGGFNVPISTRAWAVTIGTIGSTSGTGQLIDLVSGGAYYDASYSAVLTTTLTYQHGVYGFLTVVDRLSLTYTTQANTPPPFPTLQSYLKTIKARLDALQTTDTQQAKDDYTYAASLLDQIRNRICAGDTAGLYTQIQDYLNVYHSNVLVAYTNTNTAIAAYDLTTCNCGTLGGTTDTRILATDISNWNTAFAAIPPNDLEYKVGTTTGAPTAGASTFQNALFLGRRTRLTLNRIRLSTIDAGTGDPYFSKVLSSDTVQLYNYNWLTGDLVQFELY